MRPFAILVSFLLATASAVPASALGEELQRLLDLAGQQPWITVSEEGRSVGGLPIFLVHLDRSGGAATWRLLIIARQHGNEPAGTEAVLRLIGEMIDEPRLLPADVDLWLVPMANPDGAATDRRQIVERQAVSRPRRFAAGSLLVSLDQPYRLRAVMVLEPCQLYGLYGNQLFRDTVAADGTIPVFRMVAEEPVQGR